LLDWYFILADIAQWSVGIPALLGLVRIRRLSNRQKILLGLLFFSLIMQGLGDLLREWYNNNAPAFHFYVPVEFALILGIFRKELSRLLPRKIFPLLLGLFSVLSIVDAWLLSGIYLMPNYARTAESILIILLCISWFALLYREQKVLFLERQFLFWVTTGLLLFFSFNLLLYFFSNFLMENFLNAAGFLFVFHSVMVLVLNLFFSIGMAIQDPPAKETYAD